MVELRAVTSRNDNEKIGNNAVSFAAYGNWRRNDKRVEK